MFQMNNSFDDSSSVGSSDITLSSSMSGSVTDYREIVDLLSDDDIIPPIPTFMNVIPATTTNSFIATRRPQCSRITEVIDLMSDDEDNQPTQTTATSSTNSSAVTISLPNMTEQTSRISNENFHSDLSDLQVAESLLNVTNNLRLMLPEHSTEQPAIKRQKLTPSNDSNTTNGVQIKKEYKAVGFGEANFGDEVIEIENPLAKKSNNSSDLLQNENKLKSNSSATNSNNDKPRNNGNFNEIDDDDDVIEYVGGNTNVASEMPHPRESCLKFRFAVGDVQVSLKICPQCYCYVCEIKASECSEWPRHCLATHKLHYWKQEKQMRQCKFIQFLSRESSAEFFQNYRHLIDNSMMDHDQSHSNQAIRSFQDNRNTAHSEKLIAAAKAKIDHHKSTEKEMTSSDIIQIAILFLYGIRAKTASVMFNVCINNMYEIMLQIILHPSCPQPLKSHIKEESSNLKLPVLNNLCEILIYISTYINTTSNTNTTTPPHIDQTIIIKMLNLPEVQGVQIINTLISKQIFAFLIEYVKYTKNQNIQMTILWCFLKSIEDEITNIKFRSECNHIISLIYENSIMDWNRLSSLIVADINTLTIYKCFYLLDFFHSFFQSFQIQQIIGKRLLILLTVDFHKFAGLQLEEKSSEELYQYIQTYTLLVYSSMSHVMPATVDPTALLFISFSYILRIPLFDYHSMSSYNMPLLTTSTSNSTPNHLNGSTTPKNNNTVISGFHNTTKTFNNMISLPILPLMNYPQITAMPTTPNSTTTSSSTSTTKIPPSTSISFIMNSITDFFMNCHDTIILLLCRILCHKINYIDSVTISTTTTPTMDHESKQYLLKICCEMASTYFRRITKANNTVNTIDQLYALKLPKDILLGWSLLSNDKQTIIPNNSTISTSTPYDVLQLSYVLPLHIAVKVCSALCQGYSSTSKISSSKDRILYSFLIPLRILWKSFLQFLHDTPTTPATTSNSIYLVSFFNTVILLFETMEIHEMSTAISFLKRECPDQWVDFLILYYLKDLAITDFDYKNIKLFLFFRKILGMIQKNIIPALEINNNNNNNNNNNGSHGESVKELYAYWNPAFSTIATMVLNGRQSAIHILFQDWNKMTDFFKRSDKAVFLIELKNIIIEDINDVIILNNICQYLITICSIEYIPMSVVTAFIELAETPSSIFNMLLMCSKQKILKDISLLTFSPKVIEKIKLYCHLPYQHTLTVTNTGSVQIGPSLKKTQSQKLWNDIKKDMTSALYTINESSNPVNGQKQTKTPIRIHGKYATSADMILTACYLEDSELIEKIYYTTFKNKYPTVDLKKESEETQLILKIFDTIDNINILCKLIYIMRDWLAEIALLQVESCKALLLEPIIKKFQLSTTTIQNIPELHLLLFYYHPTATTLQLLFTTLTNSISLSMISNHELRQKLHQWIPRANQKELFLIEDYLEIICFHLQPEKPLLLLRSYYTSKNILTATVITRCFILIEKQKQLAKDLFNWIMSLLLQIDKGMTLPQDCRDAIRTGLASVSSTLLDANSVTISHSNNNNTNSVLYLFPLELCTLFLKLITTPTLSLFVEVQRFSELNPWRDSLIYLILDDRHPHGCIDILIHEKDYQRLFSMLMNTSTSIEKIVPLLDGLMDIMNRTRGSFLLSSVVLPLRGTQLSSNNDTVNAISSFMELTNKNSFIRCSLQWVILLYSLTTITTNTIITNRLTTTTTTNNNNTEMQLASTNIINNQNNSNNNSIANHHNNNNITSHYNINDNSTTTPTPTSIPENKKPLLQSKLELFIKTICHWSHNASFLRVYFDCCSLSQFSHEKVQSLSRNTKLMKMTCLAQQIHLSVEFLEADDFILGDEICHGIVEVKAPVTQKIVIFNELLLLFRVRELNQELIELLKKLTVTCLSAVTPLVTDFTDATMWFSTPSNYSSLQSSTAVLALLDVVVDKGEIAATVLETPLIEALAESPLRYSLFRPEWMKFLKEIGKIQPSMSYLSYLVQIMSDMLDVTEFSIVSKATAARGTQVYWIRVVGEIIRCRLSHGTLSTNDILQSIRMIVYQLQESLFPQARQEYSFNSAFVTSHLLSLIESNRSIVINEFSKLALKANEAVGKIFVEHPELLLAVTAGRTMEIFENSKTLSCIWKAILKTENPDGINALQKTVDSVVEIIDNSRVTNVLKSQFTDFFNDLKQAMQGSNIGIAKWSVIIQGVRRRLSRKKAVLQTIAHL